MSRVAGSGRSALPPNTTQADVRPVLSIVRALQWMRWTAPAGNGTVTDRMPPGAENAALSAVTVPLKSTAISLDSTWSLTGSSSESVTFAFTTKSASFVQAPTASWLNGDVDLNCPVPAAEKSGGSGLA